MGHGLDISSGSCSGYFAIHSLFFALYPGLTLNVQYRLIHHLIMKSFWDFGSAGVWGWCFGGQCDQCCGELGRKGSEDLWLGVCGWLVVGIHTQQCTILDHCGDNQVYVLYHARAVSGRNFWVGDSSEVLSYLDKIVTHSSLPRQRRSIF